MEPTSKYLIYALVDPRDGGWRYIGKSCNGLTRPGRHGSPSELKKCDNRYKNNWIKKLQRQGLSYQIEVLEQLKSAEEAARAEVEWIAEARRQGLRLTNMTDGGEGITGHRHTPETRAKMSATRGGLSLEQRERAVQLYVGGFSTREVAKEFSTGPKVAWRILKMAGVQMRPQLAGLLRGRV